MANSAHHVYTPEEALPSVCIHLILAVGNVYSLHAPKLFWKEPVCFPPVEHEHLMLEVACCSLTWTLEMTSTSQHRCRGCGK